MGLFYHLNYTTATRRFFDAYVTKTLEIRLKQWISDNPKFSETYKRIYGNYNGKIRTIYDVTIFPIYGCRTKPPMCYSQDICNYTKQGREKIHKNLRGYKHLVDYLLRNTNENNSAEFNDNRMSLIVGQQGKCYITGFQLEISNMKCHHKIPKKLGGTDEYKNLAWVCGEAYKLIHSCKLEIIEKYLGLLSLDEKGLKRVNSLRKLVGNSDI